jgi:hypothetical protein
MFQKEIECLLMKTTLKSELLRLISAFICKLHGIFSSSYLCFNEPYITFLLRRQTQIIRHIFLPR